MAILCLRVLDAASYTARHRVQARAALYLAASIELIISRASEGATITSVRVELPSRRADLVEDISISLDDTALRALMTDPPEYAAQLTAMVLGKRKLREACERARGFAEGTMRFRCSWPAEQNYHQTRRHSF